MSSERAEHRQILRGISRRLMAERGFEPEYPPRARAELEAIRGPAAAPGPEARDLRSLSWCSIDNDDSRDLDQLTVAEALPGGGTRLFVAIADVDALVRTRTALDEHARRNTTSVYTAAEIYAMLPERLSTDLTSLSPDADRLAIAVEMAFDGEGSLQGAEFHRAIVRNRAKLAYNSVAAWLTGAGAMPPAVSKVGSLDENLRLQDRLAQKLKERRHRNGALGLETLQARPVFDGAWLTSLAVERTNRAKEIIEDFMIAANGATARHLASRGLASLQRVVRTPRNWGRIVELAAECGADLPGEPDPAALEAFLSAAKARDPLRFPDLSLSVIKLIGPGEYVVEQPGRRGAGHFGLAVDDYTHSTAPNRRYPDLVVQRLLKASFGGGAPPYRAGDLEDLAAHCTEMADAARKVTRQVEKSAAALLLEKQLGQTFEALVTGAADKGTWVRLLGLPAEGRLVAGFERRKVGQRLRVRLVRTDVERGHIDFAAIG